MRTMRRDGTTGTDPATTIQRCFLVAGFLSVLLLLGSCSRDDDGPPAQPVPTASPFRIEVDAAQGGVPRVRVTHRSNPDRVLWETVPGRPFAAAAVAEATITESRGSFTIDDTILRRCEGLTVDEQTRQGGDVVLRGALEGEGCAAGFRLRFSPGLGQPARVRAGGHRRRARVQPGVPFVRHDN